MYLTYKIYTLLSGCKLLQRTI